VNERLAKIISLFEADGGYSWEDRAREYALAKWTRLTPQSREFLESLSLEDLESVCIGEVRDEELGCARHFNGSWQVLPWEVDGFLTDIWEYVE
jgi:hypothetical protein